MRRRGWVRSHSSPPKCALHPREAGLPGFAACPSRAPRFFRCESLDRQGVDVIAHARAERLIDELMAREAALSREFSGDDPGREMCIVVRFHPDVRSGQAGPDELGDLFCVHDTRSQWLRALKILM